MQLKYDSGGDMPQCGLCLRLFKNHALVTRHMVIVHGDWSLVGFMSDEVLARLKAKTAERLTLLGESQQKSRPKPRYKRPR